MENLYIRDHTCLASCVLHCLSPFGQHCRRRRGWEYPRALVDGCSSSKNLVSYYNVCDWYYRFQSIPTCTDYAGWFRKASFAAWQQWSGLLLGKRDGFKLLSTLFLEATVLKGFTWIWVKIRLLNTWWWWHAMNTIGILLIVKIQLSMDCIGI